MKASELRIGNLVYNPTGKEVRAIDCLDIRDLFEGRLINPFEPIQLTYDWLLRFGFKSHEGWMMLDAFSPGHPSQRFDLYWSKDDGFMTKSRYQPDVIDNFYMRHIKAVHSLQNLYFALTGEELKQSPL